MTEAIALLRAQGATIVDPADIRYEADRAKDLRLSRAEGLDAVFRQHRLDAILFPGGSGAAIAAKAGYPTVIVPFGLVPNAPAPPFPEAFAAQPSPFGVSFTGPACSEPRLIALAHAFEQAGKRRVPPPATENLHDLEQPVGAAH